MTISTDIVSVQPAAAPIAAPAAAQPPVAAVGQRQGANNDKRQQSSFGDRARASVAFRSFLNASTLAGLTQTLGAEAPTATFSSELRRVLRPSKVPARTQGTTLDAEESESLYNSAHAAPDSKSSAASAGVFSGAPEYLAATRSYAKSFFAVSGTFAKPGEALELTA